MTITKGRSTLLSGIAVAFVTLSLVVVVGTDSSGAQAATPVDASKVIPPEQLAVGQCSTVACVNRIWREAGPDTLAVNDAAMKVSRGQFFECMEARGYDVRDNGERSEDSLQFGVPGGYEVHYSESDLANPSRPKDAGACLVKGDDAANEVWAPYR